MTTFFIVGVQRSGTTLLQTMLEQHPDICMEPRVMGFRIITCFKNLYTLLPHNLAADKHAFYTWLIEQDHQGRLAELLDYQNIKNYVTIQDLIQKSIEKKLDQQNKKVWGDKSPNLQHYISDLKLLMPEAKIIHILRDGRANANSMHRRARRNLKWSAQQWVDGNIYSLVNQEIVGQEKYKIIHYEKLLSEPEKTLQAVCRFLEIDFHPNLLNLNKSHLAEEKRYVKSSLDVSKINQWKTQLSDQQIKAVERIQGPLLQQLGYELVNDAQQLDFKLLSLRRQIWYNQVDNFKELINPRTEGMRNREMVNMKTPFKNRLYNFFAGFVKDLFSLPIFKALFSRFFYKKKYFHQAPKPNPDSYQN